MCEVKNESDLKNEKICVDDYIAVEKNYYSDEMINEIAEYLMKRTKIRPKIGIICGSGLNSIANHVTNAESFPYKSIPHFPISTVAGHVGRLIFGYLMDVPVICMQGRFHYYEGYSISTCCMPVQVMNILGITHLLATNAAGGLDPRLNVGDIMIVTDHINIMGLIGINPLRGPNPKFVTMMKAYDSEIVQMAKRIAKEMGIQNQVKEGVYTCMGGPNYETIAELKMIRNWGIDAVGMSTVHEVLTARSFDMKAFSFSLITNQCPTDYGTNNRAANHDEVVSVGKGRETVCAEFMSRIVKAINETIMPNGI